VTVGPVNALSRRWALACGGGSTVFAGPGVWPLLALVAIGADDAARPELEKALGVPASDADARAVLELLGDCPAVRFALGLWSRAELPLRKEWLDRVPAGVPGELTGEPQVDQPRLDAWASEHTGGLIDRMPVQVDPRTLLVLASALAVRTRWIEPFKDTTLRSGSGPWAGRQVAALDRTTYDPGALTVVDRLTRLRVEGTEGIDVHLFLGESDRPAAEVLAAGLDSLSRPGIAGDALPDGRPGPGIEVGIVDSTDPRDRYVAVVPRFTVTGAHDLLALPEVCGLSTVADPDHSHLPGISGEPLVVSQARQNALAEFTAEGFYAAAVTAIGFTRMSMVLPSARARQVRVTLDRPFGFAAVHRASGLVLVAGWVAEA
jgi:serine protease inhibitor